MRKITDLKVTKAKYAEAIVMFMRLREAEYGENHQVNYKDIAIKAMIMYGCTQKEKEEVTPKNKVPYHAHLAQLILQVLKYMGIVTNGKRGYWKLTEYGRTSAYTHPGYIKAIDAQHQEYAEKRKQRKIKEQQDRDYEKGIFNYDSYQEITNLRENEKTPILSIK